MHPWRHPLLYSLHHTTTIIPNSQHDPPLQQPLPPFSRFFFWFTTPSFPFSRYTAVRFSVSFDLIGRGEGTPATPIWQNSTRRYFSSSVVVVIRCVCTFLSLSLSHHPSLFHFSERRYGPRSLIENLKIFFRDFDSIGEKKYIYIFFKYYLSGRKNRSIVKIVKVCRFVVVVSKLSWNQWIGIPILTARNNRWEIDRKSGGLFFFLSVSLASQDRPVRIHKWGALSHYSIPFADHSSLTNFTFSILRSFLASTLPRCRSLYLSFYTHILLPPFSSLSTYYSFHIIELTKIVRFFL